MPMLEKRPKIRYVVDLTPGTGHNNAARGLVACLKELGYTYADLHAMPALAPHQPLDWRDYAEDQELLPYATAPWAGDEEINLVHLNPGYIGAYWTAGRWNIAYCAWETDRLPANAIATRDGSETVVNMLNRYDEIWVPSAFTRSVFMRSGVDDSKVYVVPHALQPQLLQYDVEQAVSQAGERPLTFYSVSAWNPRKDVDTLLRAWWQTKWSVADPRRLQLHLQPPSRDVDVMMAAQTQVHEDIRRLQKALPEDRAQVVPAFSIDTLFRSYEKIVQLHAGADVYVTASRGEGFCAGLGAFEALAMGHPVIGGGGPALLEWRHLSDLVPGAVTVLRPRETPVVPMADAPCYDLSQEWWSLHPKQLAAAMEEAAERKWTAEMSIVLARAVRDMYCPKKVSETVAKCLLAARRC